MCMYCCTCQPFCSSSLHYSWKYKINLKKQWQQSVVIWILHNIWCGVRGNSFWYGSIPKLNEIICMNIMKTKYFHIVRLFPKASRCFEPINYRLALVSTLLHAIVYFLYTICWMYWYRLQIKWDYKKEKTSSNHVCVFHMYYKAMSSLFLDLATAECCAKTHFLVQYIIMVWWSTLLFWLFWQAWIQILPEKPLAWPRFLSWDFIYVSRQMFR
jgi:hypothetical protein